MSIKNTDRGESGSDFSYEVKYSDDDCGMGAADAEAMLTLGANAENIKLASGETMGRGRLIKLRVDESMPLCEIRYDIFVEKDGAPYGITEYFDVEIVS